MTVSTDTLDRFRSAQDRAGAGFAAALAEIRAGGKRSHWIWYVFPHADELFELQRANGADIVTQPRFVERPRPP